MTPPRPGDGLVPLSPEEWARRQPPRPWELVGASREPIATPEGKLAPGRVVQPTSRRDPPRTSPWGPLSWLWWPVLFAGWTLAAVVMAAEWVASGAQEGPVRPRGGPWKPSGGPGRYLGKGPLDWTPLERAENRPSDDFAPRAKKGRE